MGGQHRQASGQSLEGSQALDGVANNQYFGWQAGERLAWARNDHDGFGRSRDQSDHTLEKVFGAKG
jgi:hypothetical protein